jgi:hypothetical protein
MHGVHRSMSLQPAVEWTFVAKVEFYDIKPNRESQARLRRR